MLDFETIIIGEGKNEFIRIKVTYNRIILSCVLISLPPLNPGGGFGFSKPVLIKRSVTKRIRRTNRQSVYSLFLPFKSCSFQNLNSDIFVVVVVVFMVGTFYLKLVTLVTSWRPIKRLHFQRHSFATGLFKRRVRPRLFTILRES